MSDGQPTVTLKAGREFDAPWIVLSGSVEDIKQQIIDTFELNEDAKQQSLAELTVSSATNLQAIFAAGKKLGGSFEKPIGNKAKASSKKDDTGANGWPGEATSTEQNWPGDTEPKHPFQSVLDQIESATSVADLKKVWVRNKPAQADADVKKAFSAKGKAL